MLYIALLGPFKVCHERAKHIKGHPQGRDIYRDGGLVGDTGEARSNPALRDLGVGIPALLV